MRGRQVVLDRIGGVEAAALLVDGRLEDFLLDAPDRPRPGAVFGAVVDRTMAGQGGAMLHLGAGLTGYLRRADGLDPGHYLAVQVTGYAEEGKAVPVRAKLQFKGRLAVVTPGAPGMNLSRRISDPGRRAELTSLAEATADPAFGLILRSAAADADRQQIADEIAMLTEQAHRAATGAQSQGQILDGPGPHAIAMRDWDGAMSRDEFEQTGVLDLLVDLRRPEFSLGPARMIIEPTRALVAVDVDTGADTSRASGLKANIAAATELPRQLRLRGLGGQVVVDVAPMQKTHRPRVEAALRNAASDDPGQITIAGWTPMGHLELQRRRDRLPLVPRLKQMDI